VLDGTDAIVFFGLRGAKPLGIFHAIASGLIGRDAAIHGGWATGILGIVLHFTVAFGIVTVYHLASRRIPALTRNPVPLGILYGLVAWVVMNFVVVPLSAARSAPPTLPVLVNGWLIHAFGVGLPSALTARAAMPPGPALPASSS
jgi:hypothetical protein